MSIELLTELDKERLLITKLAKKYEHLASFEDLYSAGVLGLVKASKNFKENSNVKFSTYAFNYIKGEMLLLVNSERSIKINSVNLKVFKACEKSKEFLTQKLGKEPSIKDLSLFMNISEDKIIDAYNNASYVKSIDYLTEEVNLTEAISYRTEDENDNKILVSEALSSLSDIEKKILCLKYYRDYTQSEIAKILNTNQVNVSRIEKKQKKKYELELVSIFLFLFNNNNMDIKEYEKLVSKNTIKEPKIKNMFISFFSGGFMGILSLLIFLFFNEILNLSVNISSILTLSFFILSASILTGMHLFDDIAKVLKSGVIVPITGFAHAMASCAIDYKNEGFISGIGSNIFKLTGSIILYGIVSAVVFALIKGVIS